MVIIKFDIFVAKYGNEMQKIFYKYSVLLRFVCVTISYILIMMSMYIFYCCI